MDTVLAQLPASDAWIAHLRQRIDWAKEIYLLDPLAQPATKLARIFLPSAANAEAIRPDDALWSVLGAAVPNKGWVRKPDLYQEAADWLLTEYQNEPGKLVLCEAGMAKLGDAHLNDKPYVAFRDRPYYLLPIDGADPSFLAKVMSWGRMWQRFLGVVVETSPTAPSFEFSRGLFLCDGLDGDSLIVTPIHEASVGT
jgi:hypothetical protein